METVWIFGDWSLSPGTVLVIPRWWFSSLVTSKELIELYRQALRTVSTIESSRNLGRLTAKWIWLDPIKIHFVKNGGQVKVLGTGVYSQVLKGIYNKKKVAVKVFPNCNLTVKDVLNEASILDHLHDVDAVPKFIGVLPVSTQFCNRPALVMECIADGLTLHQYLLKDPAPHFTQQQWLNLAIQIVRGLSQIHGKNIIYNDLKINNLLVSEDTSGNYRVYYIDLGEATYNRGRKFRIPRLDFHKYQQVAPEVLSGEETSMASDVFSLGVILKLLVDLGDLDMEIWGLARCCTAENPLNRPQAVTVLNLLERAQHPGLLGSLWYLRGPQYAD